MSHLKVKTLYSEEGDHASTIKKYLYCDHNLSCDISTIYNEDGKIQQMIFQEWDEGNDLWDAVKKIMEPFENESSDELKQGVEYYTKGPWETV